MDKLKGCLLFWETDNTQSYRIERGLLALKYTGVLNVISGMLIGKFVDIKRTAWKDFEEPTAKDIIVETLKGYDFPILANMDFGHKNVNIPMPIGLKAEMEADKLQFITKEAAVV